MKEAGSVDAPRKVVNSRSHPHADILHHKAVGSKPPHSELIMHHLEVLLPPLAHQRCWMAVVVPVPPIS